MCCGSCLCTAGSCCCTSKVGSTDMVVNFDKNIFYSNEVANAMITVNNSDCKLKITEIEF